MCIGLTFQYNEGAAASVHVFPIVSIFSEFYLEDIPKDIFLVIEVKGMFVSPHAGFRFKDKVHDALLRSKEKIDQHCD